MAKIGEPQREHIVVPRTQPVPSREPLVMPPFTEPKPERTSAPAAPDRELVPT